MTMRRCPAALFVIESKSCHARSLPPSSPCSCQILESTGLAIFLHPGLVHGPPTHSCRHRCRLSTHQTRIQSDAAMAHGLLCVPFFEHICAGGWWRSIFKTNSRTSHHNTPLGREDVCVQCSAGGCAHRAHHVI